MAIDGQTPFPVPNSTVSFWRAQPDKLDDHRSTENLPSECDIVIIGAGYAGASVAYHLLENNPAPPSIVILEARQACSGATGRNGGHLKPSLYASIGNMSAKHGLEAAIELAEFEKAHLHAIKELVEKENIDCDFQLTRAFDVFLSQAQSEKVKNDIEALRKAGVSLHDVQYTPESSAEDVCGVNNAKGCASFTAGSIWPYRLIIHLLRIALSRGVNLQTHTPVSEISETPDSSTNRWTVTTSSRGSITAKKVIFATNAYTSALLPQYTGKIVPVRGICSRIITPKNNPSPYLPNTYSLRWSPTIYDYLIPRPDGSIVVGGARADYLSNLSNWYNVVDDSKLIEPAKDYFDGYMQRHFRGWKDSGAYTDRVWTGVMGYSSDYLPHVGCVPGKPEQYIIAGFTGHGMPQVFLSAKGISKMIRENRSFEESGVPRLYKTSEERLRSTENAILAAVEGDTVKAQL
ncbi:FAD dependent oxidoreductase superfamily [Paecilomyces variotii No. 5]|uniref:FAD dependent oxidoreductase superfamily n=1 Tax=Byssochlamys spectabilis (strain No. 5 / NBRC 109023) TaxID=1356009 RepID=V5I445_BYSSN|nr:FAD dependent oxidoreductase superfamily [Paecilomyces variotii No. 5]